MGSGELGAGWRRVDRLQGSRFGRPWYVDMLYTSGSCVLLILASDKEQDVYREEARELMRQVQDKCSEYDAERKVVLLVVYRDICMLTRYPSCP